MNPKLDILEFKYLLYVWEYAKKKKRGLVGLYDYKSEIKSLARKAGDKKSNKVVQWQVTKTEDAGDCDYLPW